MKNNKNHHMDDFDIFVIGFVFVLLLVAIISYWDKLSFQKTFKEAKVIETIADIENCLSNKEYCYMKDVVIVNDNPVVERVTVNKETYAANQLRAAYQYEYKVDYVSGDKDGYKIKGIGYPIKDQDIPNSLFDPDSLSRKRVSYKDERTVKRNSYFKTGIETIVEERIYPSEIKLKDLEVRNSEIKFSIRSIIPN